MLGGESWYADWCNLKLRWLDRERFPRVDSGFQSFFHVSLLNDSYNRLARSTLGTGSMLSRLVPNFSRWLARSAKYHSMSISFLYPALPGFLATLSGLASDWFWTVRPGKCSGPASSSVKKCGQQHKSQLFRVGFGWLGLVTWLSGLVPYWFQKYTYLKFSGHVFGLAEIQISTTRLETRVSIWIHLPRTPLLEHLP